ncbi:MAG TPA: hypothetical protein VFT22_28745, partial [Kofleriaceae bacterium]|nr:hypothetical protein [Kofleriaceae bacterium]
MDILNVLLLITGGILAVSGLIVAKQPNAKEVIDKLVPYQAIIGVAMLGFGLVNLLRTLGVLFTWIRISPLFGVAWLAVLVVSILLGFLFGMSQLAKWMPGTGAAEQKGMELVQKLAPYQVILGLGG